MSLGFSLLGPVVARLDDRPLSLPPGRPSVLLAALLLGQGHVSAERLMSALWDEPPISAAPNLRTYAAQLRRLLGAHADRLSRSGDGYTLRVEPDELDLHAWDRALTGAQRATEQGRPDEAADLFAAGLALWSGAAAEGLVRRGAVGRSLDMLDEARNTATERYARACVEAGRYEQAVTCLRPFVAEQPTREVAWQHLVEALARGGDRAGALAAYTAARRALIAELGIEPGPELRGLQARLLHGPLDSPPPPTGAEPGIKTLPPDADLIGRADLLHEVVSGSGGVVALHGPAGVGKSVLAVRAAWQLAADHPDGQLYLDLYGSSPGLTPMTTGDALAALLHALRAPAPAGSEIEQLNALHTALNGRRVVVVLDNVVDAAQVRRVLTGLAGATVILTSRTMLSTLDVRRQVAVAELSPESSVSLLARYGGLHRVAGSPDDAQLLAGLCGHLPLALRIVGARLASRPDWSLAAMVARLADERHRLDELAVDDLAVRAGLNLTCGTLRERPGGAEALNLFDAWGAVGAPLMGPDLARAMTGSDGYAARSALDRLAEVRLIEPAGDDRYRMHDLVRIFAVERAGHAEQAVHRARCYYLDTARRARDLLRTNTHRGDDAFVEEVPTVELADDKAALRWFETERVNLRDAIQRCARDRTADGDLFAVRLIVELYPFLPMRSYYSDWQDLAESALVCARRLGSVRDEIAVLIQLAGARTRANRHPEAIAALRAALAPTDQLDDPTLTAFVLDNLGIALALAGQLTEAKEVFGRCLRLHRANGHPSRLGITLNNLADTHRQLGEHEDALRHLVESLELRRSLGDRLGVGVTTLSIGQVYAQDGRPDEAVTWLTEARTVNRETGNSESEWRALTVRADLHRAAGRLNAAREDLEAALSLSESVGDDAGKDEVLRALKDMTRGLPAR
ncbi:MAG: tetratricopeptide repeat protein [Actinoplanes sp.]